MSSTVLQALKPPEDYRAERERIFPGRNSLGWYIRQNRSDLVAAGALLKIRGAWFIHGPRFDEFVIDRSRSAR